MEPAQGFNFVYSPDLNKVSELIIKSWARPCWNYDTGLLQLHIKRPSGDSELALGQQSDENGQLASFQAYMPFKVEYYQQTYKAVFASFLTVSPDFQGRGLAGSQQGQLIEAAIKKDYDLYLTMCEVGAGSNIAVEKIFAKKNLPVKVVNVLNYTMSPATAVKSVLPEKQSEFTRVYKTDDLDQAYKLIKDIGSKTSLRKIIPKEDIDFLLGTRPHTKTFVYEKDGKISGLINLLLLEVLELDDKKLNIYFDNVSFGTMTEEESEQFLGDVMLGLQAENYHLAFMPDIGYASMSVFKKYRFRTAPRQLNLYIAPLKDGILDKGIKEVDSFYLDVY